MRLTLIMLIDSVGTNWHAQVSSQVRRVRKTRKRGGGVAFYSTFIIGVSNYRSADQSSHPSPHHVEVCVEIEERRDDGRRGAKREKKKKERKTVNSLEFYNMR